MNPTFCLNAHILASEIHRHPPFLPI
jgi:hypothetical protein